MKVLLLRTCNANMTAHGGFKWPTSGKVTAPDWNPEPECGGGLHFLKWGCGHAEHLSGADDAVWMVCEAEEESLIDLGGKVKAPECEVLHCGTKESAIAYLDENGAKDRPVVFSVRHGGYKSTVSGGYKSTVSGGYKSTVYKLNEKGEFVEVKS